MRFQWRNLIPAASLFFLLAAAIAARAETWPLELKLLEPQDSSHEYSDRLDYIYRATSPQQFRLQITPDKKGDFRISGQERYEPAFKKLVKKEPKYRSKRPFKGVAKLGTQEFAFVLDTAEAPQPEAVDKKKEDKKKESEPAKTEAKKKEKQSKKKQNYGAPIYDRLYFDANHNGDLTDDKVIEGQVQKYPQMRGAVYAQIHYPRLEVTIDADGTSMKSSIFFSGNVYATSDWGHVGIQINAGGYREGEITLAGKKRKAVLIDFNSNGRFDDPMKVIKIRRGPNSPEEVYPQSGDVLLLDPQESHDYDSPYDITSSDCRYNVSQVVLIDGHYYDLEVTPAGDKLTLTPSKTPLGNITNPNNGFRALIHSQAGVLKISGQKDEPISVPVGEWSLLSYTIILQENPTPPKPVKKESPPADNKSDKQSTLGSLVDAVKSLLGSSDDGPAKPRWSMVSARATADCKSVKVVEGKTVQLPFGPPYKPLVEAHDYGKPDIEVLELSLVGSAGEVCTNLMTYSGRPPKPKFTITDQKGKVVQQGSFEYG